MKKDQKTDQKCSFWKEKPKP